ncbi:unnamed protein product [Protopolystoma xenopodis]|uniref:Uncharacterized protein n=1 Tax=Protopolystoma xenopodis TaxID=117903 RepID=A0A3S5CKJ3_9PLAT|nr:unnamed protein product [Protopolystoma xenopodis]
MWPVSLKGGMFYRRGEPGTSCLFTHRPHSINCWSGWRPINCFCLRRRGLPDRWWWWWWCVWCKKCQSKTVDECLSDCPASFVQTMHFLYMSRSPSPGHDELRRKVTDELLADLGLSNRGAPRWPAGAKTRSKFAQASGGWAEGRGGWATCEQVAQPRLDLLAPLCSPTPPDRTRAMHLWARLHRLSRSLTVPEPCGRHVPMTGRASADHRYHHLLRFSDPPAHASSALLYRLDQQSHNKAITTLLPDLVTNCRTGH